MKIFKNDVLVLEINNYGILKKKEFYNIDNMQDLNIAKETTGFGLSRKSYIYNLLSSMRQKLNDPLGQRAKNRKKINQR